MKNSKTLTEIEIAREALRQLAINRKLPTPDNYRSLYYQIAGVEIIDFFPEKTLKIIIEKLPRNNSDQQQIIQSFEAAVLNTVIITFLVYVTLLISLYTTKLS